MSPILTGARNFKFCDKYIAPLPGNFVPITPEIKPAPSILWTIFPLNIVFLAYSSSKCKGFVSKTYFRKINYI